MPARTKTPTAQTIRSLDNEQILALLSRVGCDITRRIKNYGSVTEPVVLLDGIKFVQRAEDICDDLYAGYTTNSDRNSLSWGWGLSYAKETLVSHLASTSFDDDEVLEGIDLDG